MASNVQSDFQRTTVTLAHSGKAPFPLPRVGKLQITLAPESDTDVPIAYFHAIGATPDVNRAIGAGVIKALCREHLFRLGEDGSEDDGDDCISCGHSRLSASLVVGAV